MLQETLRAVQLVNASAKLLRGLGETTAPGEYLRANGMAHVQEIADAWQPGAGAVLGHVTSELADLRARRLPIEGQYRVLDAQQDGLPAAPWARLVQWVLHRDSLSALFLGPEGRGKTWAAHRVAQLFHERRGWPVLVTSTYAPDWQRWERPVQPAQYLDWCAAIVEILQRPAAPDSTPDEIAEYFAEQDALLTPFTRKILVLDEMSMIVHAGPSDPGRQMVDVIQEQLRHLRWIALYVAQAGKQITGTLTDSDVILVKQPNGDEWRKSSRDADLGELRSAAYDAFRAFRADPRYAPWLDVYPDNHSWAYAHCKSMDNGRSWAGMVPVQWPGEEPGR